MTVPGAGPASGVNRALFGLLLVDTVLLAILELFYLPLRLDGEILPPVGSVPVPVTALLALVTMPLLVLQSTRLVRPRPAAMPLVVWLVVLLVLGALGPGGDHVLVADWRAILLLLCGALPAAAVLGRAIGMANRGVGVRG